MTSSSLRTYPSTSRVSGNNIDPTSRLFLETLCLDVDDKDSRLLFQFSQERVSLYVDLSMGLSEEKTTCVRGPGREVGRLNLSSREYVLTC